MRAVSGGALVPISMRSAVSALVIVLFIVSALAPFLANNACDCPSGRWTRRDLSHSPQHGTDPNGVSWSMSRWQGFIYLLAKRSIAAKPLIGVIVVVIALTELALGLSRSINFDPTNDRDRAASFQADAAGHLFAQGKHTGLVLRRLVEAPVRSRLDWARRRRACCTGGRISLSIGFVSQSIALLVGTTLGGIGGLLPGLGGHWHVALHRDHRMLSGVAADPRGHQPDRVAEQHVLHHGGDWP